MKFNIRRKQIIPFIEIFIASLIILIGITINRGIMYEHKMINLQYPKGVSALGVALSHVKTGEINTAEFWNTAQGVSFKGKPAFTQYLNYYENAQSIYRMTNNYPGKEEIPEYFKNVEIIGTNSRYFEMFNPKLRSGEFFTEEDNQDMCVIGEDLAKKMFGSVNNSIGKKIRFPYLNLGDVIVAGVLEAGEKLPARTLDMITRKTYRNINIDSDEAVIVALDTQFINFGVSSNTVWIEGNKNDAQSIADELAKKFETLSFIVNPEPTAFFKSSGAEKLALLGLNIFVGLLFIVAGMGIMGIQLININRRKEEIGLNMAVGARKRDILLMVLKESLMQFALPTILGLAAGFYMLPFLSKALEIPVLVDIKSCLISLAASILFAICTGIYPAIKGASLNPMDAMGRTPGMN